MKESDNSYRSILKGTSIFGGVQVFQMLIALIRGKFVAILLGPEGMGISSLLNSAATPLQQFSSLGINLAIVKEVSATQSDTSRLTIVIALCRKILLFTALLGAVACLILSPWLSEWTFGSADHSLWFVLLSVFIFITTMSNGEMSILQGLHHVKDLARSSLIGSAIGLLTGIPLYYLFGVNGIVPAMIIIALSTFICYRLYLCKHSSSPAINLKEHWPTIKRLIILGLTMMLASLIGSFVIYLINVYVREQGSTTDVGLYQAATSISSQYVAVIFSAMALDYFPRLTAAGNDTPRVNTIVNRQSEIISYIISPISCVLIISAPLIVRLLLASTFHDTIPLIQCMGISLYLKALAYPLGYISFSKGDKRTFLLLEGIFGNLLNLSLSLLMYHSFGLIGLGYSQILVFLITWAIYLVICRKLYDYHADRKILRTEILLAAPVILCYMSVTALSWPLSYIISVPVVIILGYLSFIRLKSRFKQS